ncbi:glycosyltransferase family 2 protein [Rhodovulum strictum]|uniref:Glycosyltransferase n=1 Tax=Rhodovulum strictum TaxID=58314 RepID=A0A844BL46_9RHOB|nr:glycosyltransferase family 2 protein [Rhodovulum strictum]MRH20717.1 glycosyltransferase [Rhodovulum strictum]
MSGPPPRVTICMPACEAETTLDRAIASVRAQTVGDWRLIVADDASGDGTWALAQAAAAADPRITALRQPARLGVMNFATGLERADTPFFVWLAADDYWGPRFLESCLNVLARDARAVSALPRCRWIGRIDGPRTDTLDGPVVQRMRRYLAAPGGTRMYGLMRTAIARAAFPRRAMNAYDWVLMTGILRAGPQIEIPEPMLFRDRTDPLRYAAAVEEFHRARLFRRFPVLAMSLAALRAGHVPLANLGDLAALNLRKHEEYLAVMHPGQFARRLRLFRALGLPIATMPGRGAEVAGQIARTDPARRAAAGRVLVRLARLGDGAAALELGHLRQAGLLRGDARAAFARAGELGLADGWFHAALAGGGDWPRIVGAAHRGSEAARAHLARSRDAGRLPAALADVTAYLLARR